MSLFYQFLFLVLTYFIAAIPFGLVLAKACGKQDIRESGSGNIGATNVARVLGKKFGLATLILDGLKGAIMVVIARFAFGDIRYLSVFLALVALVAVVAHIYPIYLKFKGGKGVATTFAVLLVINPAIGLVTCAAWLIIFAITRISAIAALGAIGVAPLYAIYLYVNQSALKVDILLCLLLAILIFIRHKENILRIKAKKENKF